MCENIEDKGLSEGSVMERFEASQRMLLEATVEKTKKEQQRIQLEEGNKKLNQEILKESKRKNELLERVLEMVQNLHDMVESEFAPSVDEMKFKIELLIRTEEIFTKHLNVDKIYSGDVKTIEVLKDLIENLKSSSVNVTADTVNTGSDLNIGNSHRG